MFVNNIFIYKKRKFVTEDYFISFISQCLLKIPYLMWFICAGLVKSHIWFKVVFIIFNKSFSYFFYRFIVILEKIVNNIWFILEIRCLMCTLLSICYCVMEETVLYTIFLFFYQKAQGWVLTLESLIGEIYRERAFPSYFYT